MDRHASGRNWSAIARRAFELELDSIMENRDMENVIARLQASREKIEIRERPVWLEKGRSWASQKAEWDELLHVADYASGEGWRESGIDDADEANWAMLSSIVAAVFDTGENLPESADMLDFAEMLTGARGKVPRVSQLEAWLDGVAEVYDAVSDQI